MLRRQALRDILTKLDSNDKLYEDLIQRIQAKELDGLGQDATKRLTTLETPAS